MRAFCCSNSAWISTLGEAPGFLPHRAWTLAEQAGDATPDGMQHLLAGAVWDADAVAMTCAATWWSICAIPARCWWSTRPVT
jgi:hypothetical protein